MTAVEAIGSPVGCGGMRLLSSPDPGSPTADHRSPHRSARPVAVTLAVLIAIVAAACTAPGADEVASPDANSPPAADVSASPDAVGPPLADAADAPDLPEVSLMTFAGETVDLHGYIGTPLVVNFWASWCPPCAAEMPDFEAVSQQLGEQVRVLGINTSDDAGLADDLAQRTGVTYDLFRDPDGVAFRAFGGFGMPTTTFVGADGTVQGTHTGFLTREALVGEIQRWLGVEVPS